MPIAGIVGASGQAIGIDIQRGMLDRLARKVDERKLGNVRLIHGDATRVHLPAETADLVFLCTVLGEIPDRAAAIRQCREMLKANGTLSITEIALDPHFQTQSAVKQTVEREGFEHVETLGRPWSYTMNYRKRPETRF